MLVFKSVELNKYKQFKHGFCTKFMNKEYSLKHSASYDQSVNGNKLAFIEQSQDYLCNYFGVERLIWLKQQHTNHVVQVNDVSINYAEIIGDGLITNLANVGLAVYTADCIPVILVDVKHNVIGIFHAGWRGIYNGIVGRMLYAMYQAYNSNMQDIKVIVGPHIHQDNYQVSQDFINKLSDCLDQVTLDSLLYQFNDAWYFDLLGYLKYHLHFNQINHYNINSIDIDTYNHSYFNSYRRNYHIYQDAMFVYNVQLSFVCLTG